MVERRERFVPRRVGQLTAELAALPWDDASGDADRFSHLSRLISALYHYEFHDRERAVVEVWDRAADDDGAVVEFGEQLTGLLDRANYVEVTTDELEEAMARESLLRLRLEVDLDDYRELLIYRKGSHRETIEIPRWRGLRTDERTITVDERVVVHTRVKPQRWFDEQGIDPADRRLVPEHVALKQFQDVPRADIEMLLPSIRVRFRRIDSLLVGIPAVASGIAVLATKLLSTLGLIFVLVGAWLGFRDDEPELDQGALVVLFGGLVAVGGFIISQWTKLKNRRLEYLKTLSETLYFRTLGEGPGVLHTLIAAAEEQEVMEVLLAYRFLLAAPEGLTDDDLDRDIERWLAATCHQDIDFEIEDALAKLRDLDLIEPNGARLRARSIPESLVRLDRRWDELFRYSD